MKRVAWYLAARLLDLSAWIALRAEDLHWYGRRDERAALLAAAQELASALVDSYTRVQKAPVSRPPTKGFLQ